MQADTKLGTYLPKLFCPVYIRNLKLVLQGLRKFYEGKKWK